MKVEELETAWEIEHGQNIRHEQKMKEYRAQKEEVEKNAADMHALRIEAMTTKAR